MIALSHKIRLSPTPAQAVALAKACGCSRFAWNWCVAKYKEKKIAGEPRIFINDLKKEFNSIKALEFPWLYESPKDSNQQPFANFQKALKAFYTAKGKRRIGYPGFKKKDKCKDSFYISNSVGSIEGNRLKIQKIGYIKMTESLRFADSKILSYTISRTANHWYVSVSCRLPDNYTRPSLVSTNILGIDLGLKTFAVTSSGEYVVSPRPLKSYQKRLRRLSKSHSRKVKGSKNKKKSQMRLTRLHEKISSIRKDFINKFTSKILYENQVVVIEDLNVKGMLKWRSLSRGMADSALAETRRQFEYKSPIFNRELVIADRFFPSSKLCSDCGAKADVLGLGEREHTCQVCGSVKDRDLNASINLKHYGGLMIEKLGAVSADVKPVEILALVAPCGATKLRSKKQEFLGEHRFYPNNSSNIP